MMYDAFYGVELCYVNNYVNCMSFAVLIHLYFFHRTGVITCDNYE